MTTHITILAGVAALASATAGFGQPQQLLRNGGMEGGAGWSLPRDASFVEAGRRGLALRMVGGIARQEALIATPGGEYTCSGWLSVRDLAPLTSRGMAYLAVYQYDLDGVLVEFHDYAVVQAPCDWQQHVYTFTAHPRARLLAVHAGLFEASGEVLFDDLSLVPGRVAVDPEEQPPGAGADSRVVAVLRDDTLPAIGAGADPDRIIQALQADGMEALGLTADELADPAGLSPAEVSVLVLPYGQTFPLEAHATLIAYLKGGGDLVTLGGYPFESPVVRQDGRWVAADTAATELLEQARVSGTDMTPDPGFEGEDQSGWGPASDRLTFSTERPLSGRRCAKAEVFPTDAVNHVVWRRSFEPVIGETYVFSGSIRTEDIAGEGFGYMAVYQWSEAGDLVSFHDICHQYATTDWTEFRFRFPAEARAKRVEIQLGIYRATGRAYFDDVVVVPAPPAAFINTANGVPRDGLDTSASQIGLCDAAARLERVARLRAAEGQFVVSGDLALEHPAEGWIATGLTGSDNARWVPLVYAEDRYGRPRGAAAALLNNYAGFYGGSTWVCFSVESIDVTEDPQWLSALADCVRHLQQGVYAIDVTTPAPIVEPGAPIAATVRLQNASATPRDLRLVVSLRVPGGEAPLRVVEQAVSLPAEALDPVLVDLGAADVNSAFCEIEAVVQLDGRPVDAVRTGLVVRQPGVLSTGPVLDFDGNYFTLDGRPTFLCGTDTYSNVFNGAAHNPLTWQRDMRRMQDFGLLVYENLQTSPGMDGYPLERLLQLDAIMELAAAHSQLYMAGLYIGADVAVSPEVMARQAAACRAYAERYRDVPGLIYYFNGDLRLSIDPEDDLGGRFAEFAGRSAVDPFPPEVTNDWADATQADLERFKVSLTADWLTTLHRAVREVDAVGPTTAEFYRQPWGGIDVAAGIGETDVANIGYFDKPVRDIERLPGAIRFADHRAQGQGVSLGEFGVKTHPAWTEDNGAVDYHIVRTDGEANELFRVLTHYAFGMGASKIQNWCLDDASERVFPWGVFYQNDLTPKRLAETYRNLGLLTRLPEPRYEPPALTVLLPDHHRLGAHSVVIHDALWRCFTALTDLHIDFNVLNELALDRLPEETRVILYPMPYCPNDAAFARLMEFVRGGGKLYLSGDIGYAPDRTRTRAQRLEELTGVAFGGERYPNIAYSAAPRVPVERGEGVLAFEAAPHLEAPAELPAGVRVLAAAADGTPVIIASDQVFFVNDPIELSQPDDPEVLRGIYRLFAEFAGLTPLDVTPNSPEVHTFRQPLTDGGSVVTVINKGGPRRVTYEHDGHTVALELGRMGTGLSWFDGRGRLRALEGQGRCEVDRRAVMDAPCHAAAVTIDGLDLRESAAVLVLPFGTGELELRTSRRWAEPVIEVGDINHGAWRTLESSAVDEALRFEIDADRAASLLLISERIGLDAAREWMTRLVREPGGVR